MGKALMQRLKQTKPFENPAQEAVVNLLLAASWTSDRLDKTLAPVGLTHVQYNVLRILRGVHPGGHPRCEIACRMIDRAPDVTRLIDRLKRAGLTERARGAEDRRESVTRITAKGLALLAKADRAVESLQREVVARLGPSRCADLSRLCESIYEEECHGT